MIKLISINRTLSYSTKTFSLKKKTLNHYKPIHITQYHVRAIVHRSHPSNEKYISNDGNSQGSVV